MKKLTNRELLIALQELTEEQLDEYVTVGLVLDEAETEFQLINLTDTVIASEIPKLLDYLDENHPVLLANL